MNTNPIWLSNEELVELAGVDGVKPTSQRRCLKNWLKKNNVTFVTACNGWPRVSRGQIIKLLGDAVPDAANDNSNEPNFEKVR